MTQQHETWKALLACILHNNNLRQETPQNEQLYTTIAKEAEEIASGKAIVPQNINTPLQSIFENLGKGEKDNFTATYFLPTGELYIGKKKEEAKKSFPQKRKDIFQDLRAKAVHDFANNNLETCLAQLARYGSSLACSALPDVSLYDHVKTSLGFAVCLEQLKDVEKQAFLLIGGDISGIQSFIYEIVSAKASKNLKGRSFYLQLFTDSLLHQILERLGLPTANVLYASGGSFYIIAPDTTDNQKALGELETELSKAIFDEHKTSLALILGWASFGKEQNASDALAKLHDKLNEKKKRKFASSIKVNFGDFFEAIELGGEQIRDAITGEELRDEGENIATEGEPEILVNKSTYQQIELGAQLRNTDYIVVAPQKEANLLLENNAFEVVGKYYYLFSKENFKDKKNTKTDSPTRVIALNDLDFQAIKLQGNHAYSFEFYGGNDFPTVSIKNKKGDIKEETKTFSEMAGQEESDREYSKPFPKVNFKGLGILRMDVDSLGTLFQSGFINPTFSRLATLSRSLDYFFKGYLNVLWNDNHSYKSHTQIIYAGGDDLFIVGKWDTLIDFAKDIQQDFSEYTCGNSAIGISGGLAIVPPKFPVSKGAEEAERLEKEAKKHAYQKREKNSINFLNFPLQWGTEFDIVQRLKNDLLQFIGVAKNRSILRRIMDFQEQAKEQASKNLTQSWRWILMYDFTRFKERLGKGDNADKVRALALIDELKTYIFLQKRYNQTPLDYNFLDMLALAARWAELADRATPSD